MSISKIKTYLTKNLTINDNSGTYLLTYLSTLPVVVGDFNPDELILSDEQYVNSSQEELQRTCQSWKRQVEYDLVFSDLRTNEIYVSVKNNYKNKDSGEVLYLDQEMLTYFSRESITVQQ